MARSLPSWSNRIITSRKGNNSTGSAPKISMYSAEIQPPINFANAYRDSSELVALCDLSPTRMAYYNNLIGDQFQHPPVPTYPVDQFDRLVREQKPDVIVVCTADFMHHHYIIRAMELGCDAITEKPMTIDAEKARAIFAAIEKTGRSLVSSSPRAARWPGESDIYSASSWRRSSAC